MASKLIEQMQGWMRNLLGVKNLVHPITGESLADLLNSNYLTDSGMTVTQETAKKVSAVYACNRILGGTVGSLPCQVYRRDSNNGRELDNTHPAYPLVHDQPNPLMSAAVFWATAVEHVHLAGNFFALIMRNRAGVPLDLLLLDPRGVDIKRSDGRLVYLVRMIDNSLKAFDQDDILHVPNIFVDVKTGKGMSTIRGGAQAIGLALAAERHSAAFLGNGAMPSLAISYPGKQIDKDAKDALTEYVQSKYGGKKAGTPMVLTENAKVESLTINAADAQLLESRQFQVVDIARLHGVPPWMIGSVEKTTSWGTGIEQMSIGFVVYTMRPLLSRFEQEINRKLFRVRERYAEFNVDGLLRGDIKSRHEAHQIALGGNQMPGWMTVNEVRKLNNLPPVPGGDELYVPVMGNDKGDPDDQAA